MTTTLDAARVELSKQMGDYWAGTTTGAGSAGKTTLVDTALMAKNNDWIDALSSEMFDLVTSGACATEERRVSALDNTTGTLTMLAHSAQIAQSVTYEVHRLFPATVKQRELIRATRNVFPTLFDFVNSNTKVQGNWLRNNDMTAWAVVGHPDNWTASVTTLAKETEAGNYKGAASCKMSTGAGYMYQGVSDEPDFINLAGKSVVFSAQVKCNTASALRLAVYDGTTITYSDYALGNSAWTTNEYPLFVQVFIPTDAKDVAFRVYLDNAAATAYVTDLRVVGPYRNRIYIGDLGIYKNRPHRVSRERAVYSQLEPTETLHNWQTDESGYLYVRDASMGLRYRIEGIKETDFSGATGAATISVEQPQLDILIAQAAVQLCQLKTMPQWTTDSTAQWAQALQYWQAELSRRKSMYKMVPPPATIRWSGSFR